MNLDQSADKITPSTGTLAVAGAMTLTTALPITSGGTGLNTLTAGYIPYGNGTSAFGNSSSFTYDGSHILFIGSGGTANTADGIKLYGTNNSGNGTFIQGFRNGSASYLTCDTAAALGSGTGYLTYVYGANPILWYVNNFNVMQIGANGGVSIGNTTDPGATNLSVTGNISAGASNGSARLNSYVSTTAGYGIYVQSPASYASWHIYSNSVTAAGTGWYHMLCQSGNAAANNFWARGDGALYSAVLGTGLVYSNGGVLTSTNPSDKNLKDNITPLTWGLTEIMALKPVSYTFKKDEINQGTQYGFIAQDVQTVMPDLVKSFEQTTFGSDQVDIYLGLNKDGIYAALVTALQELNNKFDAYVASHP